jgi:hypothetical protein
MKTERNELLILDDTALSALCRINFTKGSGPGGQKRNKTSSAVTVTLPDWNVSASDCTERSQSRNRANALRKLRMQIALNFRSTPAEVPENMECSMTSPAYPLFAAKLLDVIEAENFDHRTTAKRCGITPSGLLKKLYRDPELWQFFQFRRKELALSPLLPPR